MNILFIGPYRTNSGWGKAAKSYLRALLKTGFNIAAKPIYMCNNVDNNPLEEFKAIENKKFDNIDIVIQNVLPDLLEWHEGYNIAIFDTETKYLNHSLWIDKINLMDEVWVDSEDEKSNLIASGVKCKINTIPVPVDVDLLEGYLNVPSLHIDEINNKFTFYFIGEHNHRKNIMAFVQAFHREFNPEENVSIVIKSNIEPLKEEINEFKKMSRTKRNYVPEVFIDGYLEEANLYAIHKMCDCLVVTSRGESQCMPIIDALYFNNEVICTDGMFASSLFTNEVIKCPSKEVPVYTKTPPLPHIYTGHECWDEVNTIALQSLMRQVFNRGVDEKRNTRQFVKDRFSISAVAQGMKECLLSAT